MMHSLQHFFYEMWKNFFIGVFFGILLTISGCTIFYFTTTKPAYTKLEEQNRELRLQIDRIGDYARREEQYLDMEINLVRRERAIAERERNIYNRTKIIYSSIRDIVRGAKDDIDAIEKLISGVEKLEQMVNTYSNN